jgi:excisionase family DNA binding protein
MHLPREAINCRFCSLYPRQEGQVNRRLMSAEEAGEYLAIRKGTLYLWARKGLIPSVKIGRRLLFDVRDLDEMIDRTKRGKLPEGEEEEPDAEASGS